MTPTTALSHLDEIEARDVASLVESAAWPSVTILMDTTPAATMTTDDVARLNGLVHEAERRLDAHGALGAGPLRSHLRAQARRATRQPTGAGLVLLVSRAVQRSYRIPGTVVPRVVVESTFRTRELLETLHRTPPHLLLMVTATCAQLYRVYADTLTPLEEGGFPVQLRVSGGAPDDIDPSGAFLDEVDRRLGRLRHQRPAPLVVAGDREAVLDLVSKGRHLHRLAGVLTGPELRHPKSLYLAAKASLEEYLSSRQQEALLLLEEALRERPQAVFSGVEECWNAAHNGIPQMLVAEADLHIPAVVDHLGIAKLAAVPEPEDAEGARSDLVDDLIEVVIDGGGWVAFAEEGQLSAHSGVALVRRE